MARLPGGRAACARPEPSRAESSSTTARRCSPQSSRLRARRSARDSSSVRRRDGAGAVALGAYDQATFGSPFHLSYRYVANKFGEAQRHGFFGIGEPTLHGLWLALGSERGLLVVSPVLVAAIAGLVVMARAATSPRRPSASQPPQSS